MWPIPRTSCEYSQRKKYIFLQLNETVVRDPFREWMNQMLAYIFLIEVLEASVSSRMKNNHDK